MTSYVVVLLDSAIVKDGLYRVQQYTIFSDGELTYEKLLEELQYINGVKIPHNYIRATWLCDNFLDAELWVTALRCKYGEYNKYRIINGADFNSFNSLCEAYIQRYSDMSNVKYVEYIKAMIMGA